MKLHLIDNTTVDITRLTCAHYIPNAYKGPSCSWNINPLEIISKKESGYFAIGEWGCSGYHGPCGNYIYTPENFEQLIPISSVVRITNIGEW